MKILGIDLSISSTGWSVILLEGDEYKVIDYGVLQTKPADFENEDLRMIYIANKLKEIMLNKEIDYVAIEDQYVSRFAKTALALRKLLGALMYALRSEGAEIEYIYPTTIRKRVLNNGKAKKEEVATFIRTNVIDIGEYSDKAGKKKTSDIYDSIAVGLALAKNK